MEVYLAVSHTDGSVTHVAFQTVGRFPSQPAGGWRQKDALTRERDASDANIEYDLARLNAYWKQMGDPQMASWRRITVLEHAMFERDRTYRRALTDTGGRIAHDMAKARECHRDEIRRHRRNAMPQLDGQWMRAVGTRNKAEEDRIEAERQKWRDAPIDPRIDEASSIEELKQIKVG